MSYRKAMIFAEKHLGPEDPITNNLRSVYQTACGEVQFVNDYMSIAGTFGKFPGHLAI